MEGSEALGCCYDAAFMCEAATERQNIMKDFVIAFTDRMLKMNAYRSKVVMFDI